MYLTGERISDQNDQQGTEREVDAMADDVHDRGGRHHRPPPAALRVMVPEVDARDGFPLLLISDVFTGLHFHSHRAASLVRHHRLHR